jgi:hypothetical protein
MAGGIFTNYPFELNAKCVIFSLIIIALFFFSPPNMNLPIQILISFILFVISYVAMAWYDYQFNCTKLALKKSSSNYGITGKFKPPAHQTGQTDRNSMTPDEILLDQILIHLLHLLIFAPLFMYIGILGNETPRWAIIMLIMSLLFAMLYHGVRLIRNPKYLIGWLHIIAGLVIIPLIVMQPPRLAILYYSLIFTSIYVAIKHGIALIKISHQFN